MAFYLKEKSNSFEYYDREILIKALSQLEYGAEESLDRRNNSAIYFNTDAQYDVFTLDDAIDKLIDIVGDDNAECLLSFHKYFLMGILLIWQEEGDVASEFIQKVVTAHCENIRIDMLLSRLQGLKTSMALENNENRLVNLQIFNSDNVYDIPNFNADIPEITIKSVSKDDVNTVRNVLENMNSTKVNFSSVMVDSILGYLDYNNKSTNSEDIEIYDFLEKISKSKTSTPNDILREKRFYSKNFAENNVTGISLSQCPLPTYVMLNNSQPTIKKLENMKNLTLPNTNLKLSIGRYSSISDIVKDVKNAKKYNPNTDGINDLLFNDSCEIQNIFKTVFMNFLYERFVDQNQTTSEPGYEFLEDIFKDLLFVKDDETQYADYKNLTADIKLCDQIEVPNTSFFKYLKSNNDSIFKNQNSDVFKYLRTGSLDIANLERELIFEYEDPSQPGQPHTIKFVYKNSNKPSFFSAFIYDANELKNNPGYKYSSVQKVFFDKKEYLSAFEDTANNVVSSGIACPYYLAPYGVSLFDHTKLYLPLFRETADAINISNAIINYYFFWNTYCNTTIATNKFNVAYKGPCSSKLLYKNGENSEPLSTHKDSFCKIATSKVTVNNEYPMLCLKLLSIIVNIKYSNFLTNNVEYDTVDYDLKNNLKEYISAGRKVYLELQEIVEYLNGIPQVTTDIVRESFKKYLDTLYENAKNKNSEYSTLSGDIDSLEKLISQDNIDTEISYIAKGIKIDPSQISSFVQIIYALNEIYLIMDDMSKNLWDIVDFCNSPGVKILTGKVW